MVPDESQIDRLLRALADSGRRRVLDHLRDAPGRTQSELAVLLRASRQAVARHLATLESAELVVTVWRGREKLHYLNPLPLQALPERWVTPRARERIAALLALQQALDAAPQTQKMDR